MGDDGEVVATQGQTNEIASDQTGLQRPLKVGFNDVRGY